MGTDERSGVTEECPSAGERVADDMRDITESRDKRRGETSWRIEAVCLSANTTDGSNTMNE